ncbi:MAG: L,D-transpeptidase family protein [Deltaproteobacteria bacterium]|jgi:hypothetical protein|nr:L,D-transpeptidase family protein [Deltaproteobacteria bacterium]MBW2531291.1 L,D-transpeptidase family protein [Deltaproteobacteria bacterium]
MLLGVLSAGVSCRQVSPADSTSPGSAATSAAAASSATAPSTPVPSSSTSASAATPGAPVEAPADPAGPVATSSSHGEAPKQPGSEGPPIWRATSWSAPKASPNERQAGARRRRAAVVRDLFAGASVSFPPSQLLLRGFKRESLLEVWAADDPRGPLTQVTTYEICFASGKLGPKRREGDLQVPEGFYHIDYFNSASRFHLSMQVSYPNRSDRKRGDPVSPGGEIMIHGDCVSAGCLAMTDERIEELWLMATALRDRGGRIAVHLLPTRDIPALIAAGEQPEHHPLWRNLNEGLTQFDRTRTVPVVRIDADGRYRFSTLP